eukprot:gene4501-5518_t
MLEVPKKELSGGGHTHFSTEARDLLCILKCLICIPKKNAQPHFSTCTSNNSHTLKYALALTVEKCAHSLAEKSVHALAET